MSIGPWQLALIVLLVLVLFGRGKISELMGDFGKGIKSFKKGIAEADEEPRKIEAVPAPATSAENEPVRAPEGR